MKPLEPCLLEVPKIVSNMQNDVKDLTWTNVRVRIVGWRPSDRRASWGGLFRDRVVHPELVRAGGFHSFRHIDVNSRNCTLSEKTKSFHLWKKAKDENSKQNLFKTASVMDRFYKSIQEQHTSVLAIIVKCFSFSMLIFYLKKHLSNVYHKCIMMNWHLYPKSIRIF